MTNRKLKSAWLLTVLTTGLLIYGTLSDTVWGSTMGMIWMGYFAANAASKFPKKEEL